MPSPKKELTDEMVRALEYLAKFAEDIPTGYTDGQRIQRSTIFALAKRHLIVRTDHGSGKPNTMRITPKGRMVLAARAEREALVS